MIITKQKEITRYELSTRVWQGIPSVAITERGRIFLAFYSGAKTEDYGNYCAVIKSDDDGKTWSEPVVISDMGGSSRVYDPCVWIDPKGRLWFICAHSPEQKVRACICENPDGEVLSWSEEKEIGGEVLLNKPTVMKNGEWWFPSAVWGTGLMESSPELKEAYRPLYEREIERKAFTIVTKDGGETFEKRGGALAKEQDRSFDEHMFLETERGVEVYLRTHYGIGKSLSNDDGFTWSDVEDTEWFSPDARFFIDRLPSGNLLLISHQPSKDPKTPKLRTNLTAFLSDDNGKTWKGKLLLDDRPFVSYPDGQVCGEYIYVTYDRDRRGAGELLLAKFTEEDILKGELTSEGYLKKTVIELVRKETEE